MSDEKLKDEAVKEESAEEVSEDVTLLEESNE